MNTNSVSFSELQKFNDSNSVVMIATEFPEGFDFSKVDEFLSEQLCFSKGKNLIGVHFIEGNVRGADGRKDWLLEFDNEEVQFNPMARLKFPDLKWTSDFIDIFGDDYYKDLDDAWPDDKTRCEYIEGKTKFKATFKMNGKEDFMMLYAESADDAFRRLVEVFGDMDVEIIKVEEA